MPQDIPRGPADDPKGFGQTRVLRQGTPGKLRRAATGRLLRMESSSVMEGNSAPPPVLLEAYSSRSCFETGQCKGACLARTVKSDLGNQGLSSNPGPGTYWCGLGQVTYPP